MQSSMPPARSPIPRTLSRVPPAQSRIPRTRAQMPAVCARVVRHPLTRAASPFTHPAHPSEDAGGLRTQLAGLRMAPAGCHRVSPGDTVGSGLRDSG